MMYRVYVSLYVIHHAPKWIQLQRAILDLIHHYTWLVVCFRYLTQPAPELTPERSPQPKRKFKYEGRHMTQPITPDEMKEAESATTPAGKVSGGSIADRWSQISPVENLVELMGTVLSRDCDRVAPKNVARQVKRFWFHRDIKWFNKIAWCEQQN